MRLIGIKHLFLLSCLSASLASCGKDSTACVPTSDSGAATTGEESDADTDADADSDADADADADADGDTDADADADTDADTDADADADGGGTDGGGGPADFTGDWSGPIVVTAVVDSSSTYVCSGELLATFTGVNGSGSFSCTWDVSGTPDYTTGTVEVGLSAEDGSSLIGIGEFGPISASITGSWTGSEPLEGAFEGSKTEDGHTMDLSAEFSISAL